MYKSVYLYEQLRLANATLAYMNAINESEDTDEVADTEKQKEKVDKTVNKISAATNNTKTKLFDKRKKGVVTAKKLLSKFNATNSSKSPYGLVHKEYATFKSDEEIKKLHETAVKYLDQFNPRTALDSEVKLFISDIESNKQYKGLCTIFGENEKCSSKDKLITKKEDKELTKKDIAEAVSYMENFSENCSEYNIVRESFETYGLSQERKTAANYKAALLAIADEKYYNMMSQKLSLEFAQVSQVLTEAMYYDPRNIKDSREIMDEIAFAYKYAE